MCMYACIYKCPVVLLLNSKQNECYFNAFCKNLLLRLVNMLVRVSKPLFALLSKPLFALLSKPLFALLSKPLFALLSKPLFALLMTFLQLLYLMTIKLLTARHVSSFWHYWQLHTVVAVLKNILASLLRPSAGSSHVCWTGCLQLIAAHVGNSKLEHGVPQGSVLSSVLPVLYTQPIPQSLSNLALCINSLPVTLTYANYGHWR